MLRAPAAGRRHLAPPVGRPLDPPLTPRQDAARARRRFSTYRFVARLEPAVRDNVVFQAPHETARRGCGGRAMIRMRHRRTIHATVAVILLLLAPARGGAEVSRIEIATR